MTANTVRLTFTGNEKDLERAFDRVGHSADRFGAGLGKLAIAAGVAGVAAGAMALKFGVDSVKAFMEAEKAQAQLQDAFDRFPALADTNIKSLQKLNIELMKKTRFDDDATASGQAVLAQFRLTGTQLKTLTPLLQDYAAKTGKDLPDAAQDLGKAILGQGRALKAIGLDFQDAGSEAANFDQLVAGLRTQVGGFAEKEGQTAAGKLEILKNRFGELQETIGAKLLPIVTIAGDKLITFVDEGIAKFEEFGPKVQAFAEGPVGRSLKGGLETLASQTLAGVKDAFGQVADSIVRNQEEFDKLGVAIGNFLKDSAPAIKFFVEAIGWDLARMADNLAIIIKGLERLQQLWQSGTVTGTKPSTPWSTDNPPSGVGKVGKLGKMHSGGVVPGPPGTEVLSILQAGERVTPAGSDGGRMVLEIRSSGRDVDDLIAMLVSRVVKARGGNVQTALGR